MCAQRAMFAEPCSFSACLERRIHFDIGSSCPFRLPALATHAVVCSARWLLFRREGQLQRVGQSAASGCGGNVDLQKAPPGAGRPPATTWLQELELACTPLLFSANRPACRLDCSKMCFLSPGGQVTLSLARPCSSILYSRCDASSLLLVPKLPDSSVHLVSLHFHPPCPSHSLITVSADFVSCVHCALVAPSLFTH